VRVCCLCVCVRACVRAWVCVGVCGCVYHMLYSLASEMQEHGGWLPERMIANGCMGACSATFIDR